jgi:hypothetical protein
MRSSGCGRESASDRPADALGFERRGARCGRLSNVALRGEAPHREFVGRTARAG